MKKKYKVNEITFSNVALDCCAIVYLNIFWVYCILLPLFSIIYFIIHGFKNSSFFFIIWSIIIVLSFIPFFASKGIIRRKRFYFLMGILVSIFFMNIDIKVIKTFNEAELIKNTGTILDLIMHIFSCIILLISLFIKGLYKK